MTDYEKISDGIFVKVEVNTRYRVCERKHVYRNQAEAQESADRSSRASGEDIQPYKCGICSCWHIGHAKNGGPSRD